MTDSVSMPMDNREFNSKIAKERMFLGMFAEYQASADCYFRGYRVLRSGDNGSKYDIIVDRDGTLVKLQVKALSSTGQVAVGSVRYSENLYDGRGRQPFIEAKYTISDFDYLALVDRATREVFYVPVTDIDFSKAYFTLRQGERTRYASF